MRSVKLPGEEEAIAHLAPFIQAYSNVSKSKKMNWNAISQLMATRSEVDCRLKWSRCLTNKSLNLSFTFEEDLQLISAIEQHPDSQRPAAATHHCPQLFRSAEDSRCVIEIWRNISAES